MLEKVSKLLENICEVAHSHILHPGGLVKS